MKQERMMTCECGLSVAERHRRRHRKSVYHRQHRRIRALLSDHSITFAEIAARFGITRERVRQMARQLGIASGRERRGQHTLDQRMSAWEKQNGYRELIAKGKELGYAVTPIRRNTSWGWQFEQGVVAINGWRAQIVYIWPWGRYLAMTRSVHRADFFVGISPIGFFVFPSKIFRTFPKRTAFSPTPCPTTQKGATGFFRHDYLNYLEAWESLRRRR
jgi:hypothetical protein